MVASGITDITHLKTHMASFLLARLNPELSRATCCMSIRYTCRPLSPNFSLSPEVSSSNANPARFQLNNNCPAVVTKGFAIKGCAYEGALNSFSKYSSNSFSQVSSNWLSTLIYSPRLYVWWPNSDFFWTLRNPVISCSLPFLSSYPRLSTKSGRYFSLTVSRGGHWSLVFQCSGVDSRSIPCRCPLSTFVHW